MSPVIGDVKFDQTLKGCAMGLKVEERREKGRILRVERASTDTQEALNGGFLVQRHHDSVFQRSVWLQRYPTQHAMSLSKGCWMKVSGSFSIYLLFSFKKNCFFCLFIY